MGQEVNLKEAMNHELAKKLKDAGFPQFIIGMEKVRVADNNELTAWPTLSHLIEACGDHFIALRKLYTTIASGLNAITIWEAVTDGFEQQGHTPEIAIANLYIALNKK